MHDHAAASRTSASPSLSGRAVPHVVYAGDENHLVGYAGPARSTSTRTSRRFGERAPDRRRGPAAARAPTTSSSTRASEVARRPVHVPLLGERHDAADAAARCRRDPGTIAVSITDAGSGVDPRSIRATVDGRDVARALRRRQAVVRADPGKRTSSSSRPPTTRRRRTWRTSRRSSRTRRRSTRTVIVRVGPDRYQRRLASCSSIVGSDGEVALDRARELLGVRRDDLQLLLAARAIALTARVPAEAAATAATTRSPPTSTTAATSSTIAKRLTRRRIAADATPFLAASAGTLECAAATRAPRRSSAVALTGCGGCGARRDDDATADDGRDDDEAKPRRDRRRGRSSSATARSTPVTVHVPPTQAVARAALEQLLAGPPRRLHDGDPARRRARGRRDRGRHRDGDASRPKLGTPTRSAQGQIVCTLTQFPSVRAVRIEVDGNAGDAPGRRRRRPHADPATAADYADLTPDALIFVRTPARDSTVTSPVDVAGTADRLRGDDPARDPERRQARAARRRSRRATAPRSRGTWSATLDAADGRRDARPLRAVGRGRLAPARDGGPAARAVVPTNGQWEPRPNRGYNARADRSPVAQLAEHSAVNRNVVGSSPTRGARKPLDTRQTKGAP